MPALYVGTDGKLRGEHWQGTINPITSTATVNDNTWHHAVLTSTGNSQSLYLDGAFVQPRRGDRRRVGDALVPRRRQVDVDLVTTGTGALSSPAPSRTSPSTPSLWTGANRAAAHLRAQRVGAADPGHPADVGHRRADRL